MRADIELSALWQVPKKRADLNLSDEVPSIDLNGVDTRGLRWLVSEEIDEGVIHRSCAIAQSWQRVSKRKQTERTTDKEHGVYTNDTQGQPVYVIVSIKGQRRME